MRLYSPDERYVIIEGPDISVVRKEDYDRLKAQVDFVRKWAACQAGLSRVRIEEVREMTDTLNVYEKV